MNETKRNDVGLVTYSGQNTAPNITEDCGEYPCDQHYVVRIDGTWVRGFHNERDARLFAEDLEATISGLEDRPQCCMQHAAYR